MVHSLTVILGKKAMSELEKGSDLMPRGEREVPRQSKGREPAGGLDYDVDNGGWKTLALFFSLKMMERDFQTTFSR
jgi:hypothetical protein